MPRNPFMRSVSVPSEVLAAAPLEKGEKVLAGTPARDGSWVLGTRDALLIVPALVQPSSTVEASSAVEASSTVERVESALRIPWEQVERADWDRDDERLVVTEVGEFGRLRPRYVFQITDPGLLLELVRERVTASVVLQRRVVVEDTKGLFVIARRAPRGNGPITWAYEFDRGVDPDDPAVMAAAQRGLDAAAEELGL